MGFVAEVHDGAFFGDPSVKFRSIKPRGKAETNLTEKRWL